MDNEKAKRSLSSILGSPRRGLSFNRKTKEKEKEKLTTPSGLIKSEKLATHRKGSKSPRKFRAMKSESRDIGKFRNENSAVRRTKSNKEMLSERDTILEEDDEDSCIYIKAKAVNSLPRYD